MLPTPLVSFVATIGFIGGGIGGSILMLIGIFTPATFFPIIGHEILQKLVDNELVQPFLDGVAAAVLGLLLQTAFQVLYS
jgi:chromate transport protein ChrA